MTFLHENRNDNSHDFKKRSYGTVGRFLCEKAHQLKTVKTSKHALLTASNHAN